MESVWGVGSDILAVVYSLWEPETFFEKNPTETVNNVYIETISIEQVLQKTDFGEMKLTGRAA